MKRFIIDWLMVHIEDKLDRDQFGGQAGHSIAHYLIEIKNFILYNQELSTPLSTIFAGVDISKGFNKQDHNIIMTLSHIICPHPNNPTFQPSRKMRRMRYHLTHNQLSHVDPIACISLMALHNMQKSQHQFPCYVPPCWPWLNKCSNVYHPFLSPKWMPHHLTWHWHCQDVQWRRTSWHPANYQ